jgi:protein NDRG1
MDDRRSENVMRYLQAIHQRQDLRCRTLILVGDQSPFYHDSLHMSDTMNRRYNALIEVRFDLQCVSLMMRTHHGRCDFF